MNKNVIQKSLKSELLLHDISTDSVHVLNRTARKVYELMEEGRNLSEIEIAIRQKFRIPKETDVSQDLLRCMEELKKKGLLDNVG
jgi:tRNA pseudouridine-54 N-methylase